MRKKASAFVMNFAYTMFLLLLMTLTAVLIFAGQFLSFYEAEQRRQLSHSFEPMLNVIADKENSLADILQTARRFSLNNQSFEFMIQDGDGNTIFTTPDAVMVDEKSGQGIRIRFMSGIARNQGELTENVYIFSGYGSGKSVIDYRDLVRRCLLALALMLVIAIFGAVLFAKKVTKPLEDEIMRERAMEENQRLFFSAASHELKTPIAAARALVEGMLAGVGDYRDHHKYLRECMKTLDAQAGLVSEILEIVKLSGDEAEPQVVVFNLAEPGNAVLAEYRPLAELRGLPVQGSFPDILIQSNRALLQRVFSNVMANAVQHTPEGGTIRIEMDSEKKNRLRIINTGARIPEEIAPRIFEPFYRVDSGRTKHSTGAEDRGHSFTLTETGTQSGLGLAIVKKALDRLNLRFSLENTGEGVVFWVELPIAQEAANFRKTSDKIQ